MHRANPSQGRRPVVGIVSPGEMGTMFGRLLVEHGFSVVTTLEGRSPRTFERCSRAGLRPLHTFEEVVAASDVFVSLVPPNAAVEVAESYARTASVLDRPPLYVDANSVAPATVARIQSVLEECGAPLVDASIHGLASRLKDHGTLFLSGPEAKQLATTWAGVVRIEVLADRCGAASMFKMLLSGVSKGLVGLFVEMGLTAAEADMLDPFVQMCRAYYPGLMEAIDRLLPTLPRHARRRAVEMDELQHTVYELGLSLQIAAEIGRLYRMLGDSALSEHLERMDPSSMAIIELLQIIREIVPLGPGIAEPESTLVSCN